MSDHDWISANAEIIRESPNGTRFTYHNAAPRPERASDRLTKEFQRWYLSISNGYLDEATNAARKGEDYVLKDVTEERPVPKDGEYSGFEPRYSVEESPNLQRDYMTNWDNNSRFKDRFVQFDSAGLLMFGRMDSIDENGMATITHFDVNDAGEGKPSSTGRKSKRHVSTLTRLSRFPRAVDFSKSFATILRHDCT
jgi:hypothetical protein